MSINIEHKNLPLGQNHAAFNWKVNNVSDLNLISVVTADINKEAYVEGTKTKYVLKSVNPAVWDAISGTGGEIDDTQILVDKTWSSSKLNTVVIPVGGTTGQVLAKTSATDYSVGWTTVATSLASLTDAAITSPTSGQYLTYNGTKWINGALILVTANDVEITDATKGVILKSAGGTRYRVTVDNDGSLVTTVVV